MKFFIKILLIFFFITFYSNAYSNNLAFVNIEYLFENSNLGKSVSQNLNTMNYENCCNGLNTMFSFIPSIVSTSTSS